MFKIKRHVGRPSNEELRKKRNKKLIITLILLILILVVVNILLFNGHLSGLMGNSITVEYYCPDESYILNGDECVKNIMV